MEEHIGRTGSHTTHIDSIDELREFGKDEHDCPEPDPPLEIELPGMRAECVVEALRLEDLEEVRDEGVRSDGAEDGEGKVPESCRERGWREGGEEV